MVRKTSRFVNPSAAMTRGNQFCTTRDICTGHSDFTGSAQVSNSFSRWRGSLTESLQSLWQVTEYDMKEKRCDEDDLGTSGYAVNQSPTNSCLRDFEITGQRAEWVSTDYRWQYNLLLR